MGQKAEIIQLLKESSKPLSDGDIANELGITTQGMWNARKDLQDEGVIESVGSNPQRWTHSDEPHDISEPDETNSANEKSKASMRLERNLEKYMFENLSNLESGLSTIDEGKSQQRKVDSGRLDILAKDERGSPVVIELKAGKAEHDALGQTMSYMADIGNEFSEENVRGIIVAESFSKQLTSAASIQPNIELHRYNVQFTFERAD